MADYCGESPSDHIWSEPPDYCEIADGVALACWVCERCGAHLHRYCQVGGQYPNCGGPTPCMAESLQRAGGYEYRRPETRGYSEEERYILGRLIIELARAHKVIGGAS